MRIFLPVFFLLAAAWSIALSAQNVDWRSTTVFSNQRLSNIWGYAAGGREYALVGGANGLIIVDVTDPDFPVQIIQIPGPASSWREIKTFSHYAYVVSEGGGGVQIVDLTNLPGTSLPYHSYLGNGAAAGLNTIHALHVDEVRGFLYLYGTNLFSQRPIALNLNADPYNPTYAGHFSQLGYSHDGYVNNDTMFAAHIHMGLFSVVDMTNKAAPVLITTQFTPGLFTHNTWRSGNTIFTTDENGGSFLAAYDVTNLGNITLLDKIRSNASPNSVVHNTYTLNGYAVTSWYRDGFTIVDVSRPANMVQVGAYDNYGGSGYGFDGCWGVYPYLPSGNILTSVIKGFGTNHGEMSVYTPTYLRACHLEGQIRDAVTSQPLTGATIQIVGSGTPVETSGANGLYKMGQVQSGTFTVKVTRSGYQNFTTSIDLQNGELTVLDVNLLPVGLPVELVRFDAVADGRDALLTWETASEVNNAGFEIEHGTLEGTFEKVGFVEARGGLAGPAAYSFRLPGLNPGRHFFRLRQTDLDGTGSYSPVRSLLLQAGTFSVRLHPSIVSDRANLYVVSPYTGTVALQPLDAALLPMGPGRTFELKEGTTAIPLEMQDWAPGVYFIVVQSARDRVVARLVKR